MSEQHPIPIHPRFKNLAGHRFGQLSVVGYAGPGGNGAGWVCRCDCGVEKVIRRDHLVDGQTISCGCVRRAAVGTRNKTHGHATKGAKTPEFRTWMSMIQRCRNPRKEYRLYSGRGIKVCERWMSFENFFADMGPRPSSNHSIDRIDNDKGYSPENCRWATDREQASNRSDTRKVTFNGETMCIAEWARKLGINGRTVSGRIKLGWTVEDALFVPLKHPPTSRLSKADAQ